MIDDHLPSGWHMTAIILDLNNDMWEVTAWDDTITHAVMKCEMSLEEAFAAVRNAIREEDYWSPSMAREGIASNISDILSLMGVDKAKPQPQVKRRSIP